MAEMFHDLTVEGRREAAAEKCLICEGTGKIWRVIRVPRRGHTEEGRFDCHECGGTGKITWQRAK